MQDIVGEAGRWDMAIERLRLVFLLDLNHDLDLFMDHDLGFYLVNLCYQRMVVPVADIKTLIIFFLTVSAWVLAISGLTTAELGCHARCLAALPLSVGTLGIPVV